MSSRGIAESIEHPRRIQIKNPLSAAAFVAVHTDTQATDQPRSYFRYYSIHADYTAATILIEPVWRAAS